MNRTINTKKAIVAIAIAIGSDSQDERNFIFL
jgi:hypothetical protein